MFPMDRTTTLITLGHQILNKFDPECMIFLVWRNSFEFIIDILKVPDDKKAYFLLNMIESSALNIIRRKIPHVETLNLSYDILMSKLEEIFSHYQEEFAARYRFDWRDQIKGESVKQYAKALTKLISKCNYGPNTSSNLLNRFIIGLRNKQAQGKLLKMLNLTFDNAVYLAEGIEFLERSY